MKRETLHAKATIFLMIIAIPEGEALRTLKPVGNAVSGS
jgi:hypothetical protein